MNELDNSLSELREASERLDNCVDAVPDLISRLEADLVAVNPGVEV